VNDSLSKEQINDIIISLGMRINYIQTGKISMSSEDAKNAGKSNLIKPLSEDQMEAILRMRKVINLLTGISTGKARVLEV